MPPRVAPAARVGQPVRTMRIRDLDAEQEAFERKLLADQQFAQREIRRTQTDPETGEIRIRSMMTEHARKYAPLFRKHDIQAECDASNPSRGGGHLREPT